MWCFRWLVCVVLVGLASQTSAQTLSLEKILDNIPKPKSSPQLLPPKSVNYVTISELKGITDNKRGRMVAVAALHLRHRTTTEDVQCSGFEKAHD